MIQKINDIFKDYNIQLDFDKEVIPLSQYHDGGSITERHLLFALSKKIVRSFGNGQKLVDFLKIDLGIDIKPKIEKYLLDENNDFYEYDLLGVLKSDLVDKIYIDATLECPDVRRFWPLLKRLVPYLLMHTWEMWRIL